MTDQALTPTPAIAPASTELRPAVAQTAFDLPRGLIPAVQSVTRLLRRRRDRAYLAELPDYLLEDIGLTRADLPKRPPVGDGWR